MASFEGNIWQHCYLDHVPLLLQPAKTKEVCGAMTQGAGQGAARTLAGTITQFSMPKHICLAS